MPNEQKHMQPYTYVNHKSFPFSFYLTEKSTCSLCELVGRPESQHSYLTCPACFNEAREYEKIQELQDFLFGEMPEEQRGYNAETHAKVRLIEIAISVGNVSRDEGCSILQDLAQTLQYPYSSAKKQQQSREAAKQSAEYHLFS